MSKPFMKFSWNGKWKTVSNHLKSYSASLQKSLNSSHIRMLRVVLNVNWRTTSPIVTSLETSLSYQIKSLRGGSGLQATVNSTKNSLRTTLFYGSQPMSNVTREDPQ